MLRPPVVRACLLPCLLPCLIAYSVRPLQLVSNFPGIFSRDVVRVRTTPSPTTSGRREWRRLSARCAPSGSTRYVYVYMYVKNKGVYRARRPFLHPIVVPYTVREEPPLGRLWVRGCVLRKVLETQAMAILVETFAKPLRNNTKLVCVLAAVAEKQAEKAVYFFYC